MKHMSIVPVLLALLLSLGCTSFKDRLVNNTKMERQQDFTITEGKRVAVTTFRGSQGRALSDLLGIELLTRNVDVVERDSLDRIVAEVARTENGMYDNDLSTTDILKQIGKIVGADYIIVGESYAAYPSPLGYLYDGFGNVSFFGAGKHAPIYPWMESRLTLRVFSVQNGEVKAWGTTETYIISGAGDNVHVMDYLRMTAKRAVDALMNASIRQQQIDLKDEKIGQAFN